MRIRLFALTLCLVLPLAARAATTDVEQQGTWTLRTATSAQMTKDYFCASEGHFARGFSLVAARNLLGQSSLVLTWPGANLPVGTTVPLRISADKKAILDIKATAKTPETLVAALGWDDEAMASLGEAHHINVVQNTMTVRYDVKNGGAAFGRLNSCTASLLDRLPDSSGLSPEVRKTLKSASMADVRVVQVVDDKKGAENFIIGGIFGGSAPVDAGKSDVSQRMLDYIDQLELLCASRFSSELGAPVPGKDGDITTAEAKCDALHTGTITALAFTGGDSPRVYYFETDKAHAIQATQLRDKLVSAMKAD